MMRKVIDLDKLKDEEDLENRKREYERYLNSHINGVKKYFKQLFLSPSLQRILDSDYEFKTFTKDELESAIEKASKIVDKHDSSKWDEEEFDVYRYKFYPTVKEKSDKGYESKLKDKFKEAWIHHYMNNEHHTEYWCKSDSDGNMLPDKDMPLEYILEMLCDWCSMSFFKNTKVVDWYENFADKEKSHMTDKTKSIVDELLYDILPYIGVPVIG